MSIPLAVVCSDLHFSDTPPTLRKNEVDWYQTQYNTFQQIKDFTKNLEFEVPVLIAGDIFDKWDSPASLINMVIDCFKGLKVYAVPGQHDLPMHNFERIEDSAYWTLAKAKAITPIGHGEKYTNIVQKGLDDVSLKLYGFPWGKPINHLEQKQQNNDDIHIALVHKYIWWDHKGTGMIDKNPMNSIENALNHVNRKNSELRNLLSYDFVVSGDNHTHQTVDAMNKPHFDKEVSSIIHSLKPCQFINCGCMMRRSSNELKLNPSFGMLYANDVGECLELGITSVSMNTKDDVYNLKDSEELEIDTRSIQTEVLKCLDSLTNNGVDFSNLLKSLMQSNKLQKSVQTALTEVHRIINE